MKVNTTSQRWILALLTTGFVVLLVVLSMFESNISTQVSGMSVRGLGNVVFRSEVDSAIKGIGAKDGEVLAKGTIIVYLNNLELEAELNGLLAEEVAAVAQLKNRLQSKELQEQELKAVVELVQKGLEPAKELRKAQLDMNLIESQIAEQEAKLSSIAAQKSKLDVRLMKYQIIAPVQGRLLKLYKFNIGDAIKAGDPIAEFIPDDGPITFEVKVPPSDISMVKVGNPARIALATFNRYEVPPIKGKVSYVSPSALSDADGKSFFIARILPDDTKFRTPKQMESIDVGMAADISISSGTRSVLSFLLSPLIRGASTTFTER